MWNRVVLNNGEEVYWSMVGDMLEVRCSAGLNAIPSGCCLNICDLGSGYGNKMCVGSFSEKNGEFQIHKAYTKAYLELNNISGCTEPGFEITDTNGNIISASFDEDDKTREFNFDEDFSLTRAKSLLGSAGEGKCDFGKADKVAQSVGRKMVKYNSVEIPCFSEFNWIKVDSFEENFGLSAVSHLTYDVAFLQMFCCFKQWYFGRCSDRMFAVCARGFGGLSLFSNASDCTGIKEADGECYYAVGIALLDDGQYFYRIEN